MGVYIPKVALQGTEWGCSLEHVLPGSASAPHLTALVSSAWPEE